MDGVPRSILVKQGRSFKKRIKNLNFVSLTVNRIKNMQNILVKKKYVNIWNRSKTLKYGNRKRHTVV